MGRSGPGPLHQTTKDSHKTPLWKKLAGDTVAAVVSAALLTPAITIIDRQKLSGQKSLTCALKENIACAVLHPKRFMLGRPFTLVCGLYSATFGVANMSETLGDEVSQISMGTLTFLSVTAVNVPLGIWKDLKFANMYGSGNPNSKTATMPSRPYKAAVSAFLVRDSATIFGSFCLAPWLADAVPDFITASQHMKGTISQMTVPMLAQSIATPAHLVGLDYYSGRRSPWREKASRVKAEFPSAGLIRCVRVVPTFGLGCVLNKEIRAAL
ncbi:hypothetical protein B0J15DRAFT_398871 [Fusarium solani]|uniref:Sequence orphan n=1 Tax=Fusarium solani TaxID=169388 RepID=A0A9P9HA38_FUSSL|nr:uncharacterized protein B0J15DRAFT_398871 [Fusarium solani]KAH7252952.1 hypothetical protein B0J15DRAFT_398871 [Fusarium solani]